MEYRLDKQTLLKVMSQWNSFLKRKVHLIACGGTALTLLEIKPSTKDVDFMVPQESEYKYLVKTLNSLGYRQVTGWGWSREGEPFIFDLFPGKRIHTTELLHSPLEAGNNQLLHEFSRLYIGILNEYDLISSKLFRGTRVDFDDCLMLVRARRTTIDINHLVSHFNELASYDISEDRLGQHIEHFLDLLKQEGLYG
jgi:hypothetical protein